MKKTFPGGVHPLPSLHQGKPLTNDLPVKSFVSDTVCIPMNMHIAAAPSKPVVKKGDSVSPGTTLFIIGADNTEMCYQISNNGDFITPLDILQING